MCLPNPSLLSLLHVCMSYSLFPLSFPPHTFDHVIPPPPQVQQENELKRLKADLLEMKKQRVKMLNQMRTEATTKKLEDQRKSKEIAQLKKDSQKKECRIKSLEADAKRREFVLKRRQEEVWLHGWGVWGVEEIWLRRIEGKLSYDVHLLALSLEKCI